MPYLPELDEENGMQQFAGECLPQSRRQIPPSLPPAPPDMTPKQLKRRMIVAAIVHSENNYVATLQRLVNEYKKQLEESNPPILSATKISTLFHRLPEILQCHSLFRIVLAESVRNWDREERIGDVFIASFSKAIVLDIYSGFINNFSIALDLAKQESKRKSALADFLKVKQISSHDRLSFFGLMVKPVQRFPQFILFLQDLLKYTPHGHHDRMSLQLALTQLESLAEMLNERKRESEQYLAFKEMLRHISGKFSIRPLSDGNRYLLREDNVTQLEFNHNGMITKTKRRRLLLLNDLVVCVSVAPKQSDDFSTPNERLSLKWSYPVSEIEIQDTSASPTLTRILTSGLNRSASLKSNSSSSSTTTSPDLSVVDNICTEMNDLMHDYEVMSRVLDLVTSLKATHKDLIVETNRKHLQLIQSSIQHKDEEIAWVDSCCLQLVAKGKNGKEGVTFTFQTDNPSVKKEWTTELRLAQLALDPTNSPAWEVPEQEHRPSTKMPLFVKAQPVFKSQHQTEVRCGCFFSLNTTIKMQQQTTNRRKNKNQSYLWICTTDGASSHIAILQQHNQQTGILRDVDAFDLIETQIIAMEFIRGIPETNVEDQVWFGTDSRKLLLYSASDTEHNEITSCTVPGNITNIKYHCDSVFVALENGTLLIFRRNFTDGSWLLKDPQIVTLGNDPVANILPINMTVYAACGPKVYVLDSLTGEIQKHFSAHHEKGGNVHLMAHSGIGLWVSLKNSSTVCLYHTETFKHLQDINIASNVMRIVRNSADPSSTYFPHENPHRTSTRSAIYVTALMACRGLLWVGTNVGICLTIPLPRLEGVPIISGRVNISYHAHFGPISFLLALYPSKVVNNAAVMQQPFKNRGVQANDIEVTPATPEDADKKLLPALEDKSPTSNNADTLQAKIKHQLTGSPVVLRRRRSKDVDQSMTSRLSKTLPRGLGCGGHVFSTSTTSSQSSGDTCDVYGLYGELMYIKDYDGDENLITDPVYETLRRSDPELAAIPNKVSTLDRRLRMKVSRPRSLDLSNWSVDSRSSSLYTTSSGSEDNIRNHSRSVSRNNSNASRNAVINEDHITSTPVKQIPEDAVDNIVISPSKIMAIAEQTPLPQTPSTSILKSPLGNSRVIASNTSAVDMSRRTVITLMGGRGYVNWRQPSYSSDKHKQYSSLKEPNSNDAHIVIWELKL